MRLTRHEESAEQRKPGGLEGRIRMSPDFDRDDERIITVFEDSRVFPGSG